MYSLCISKRRNMLLFISVIVLFTIIEPAYLGGIEPLHSLYRICKIGIAACILLYFIIVKRKTNIYILVVAGFASVGIISTILNKGAIYESFRRGAYMLALALFMSIVIEIDSRVLLKALSIVLGLYVHINMLTRILYPNGLFVDELVGYKNCWFLGYDNLAAIIIILAQIVSVFRIVVDQNRAMFWDKSVVISGAVFLFWQQIATGILAECLFIFILMIMRNPDTRRMVGKAQIFVIGMFALFIFLQFFSIQQPGAIARLFVKLGKDGTLTWRMLLWQRVWKDISSTWSFWGLGIHDSLDYVSRFGSATVSHFHCNYLQVLYERGIVGMILLFAMFYYPAHCFDNRKKEYPSMIILGGLAAIMLIWQVEAYFNVTTYFIVALTLLYYSDKIEPSVLAETQKLKCHRRIRLCRRMLT